MPRPLSIDEIADFRDRLCDAAAKLFAELGEAGFTLRQLANELQVSAMTPYRYFKDKDEILAAVRARAFTKFAEALENAYQQANDPVSRANATGEAYIRFALEDPTTYKLMFDMSQCEDGTYPELDEAATRARQTMTRHIHPLIEAGLLEGDPVLIGHVFWVVLHGCVTLQLASKLGPECDMRKIMDGAFRALTAGFQPKRQGA